MSVTENSYQYFIDDFFLTDNFAGDLFF